MRLALLQALLKDRETHAKWGAVLLQVPLYERMRANDRFIALEMTEKDNNNMRKNEFR